MFLWSNIITAVFRTAHVLIPLLNEEADTQTVCPDRLQGVTPRQRLRISVSVTRTPYSPLLWKSSFVSFGRNSSVPFVLSG